MAIYHFHATIIGRSAGRSAVATAAYQARARIEDERMGQTHDWRAKGGLLDCGIETPAATPDWMRDRAQLWNAVERVEKKKNSQLARWIDVALPDELTPEARRDLLRGFVQSEFVDRGMIADWAIHAPGAEGDHRNHHAHIMLTMRTLTGEGFARTKNEEARSWNSDEQFEHWREAWAEHSNRALERAGHSARIDHRGLEAQGIDRTPTVHLGPDASAMERQGIGTDKGDQNRQAASNDNTAEIRQLETHIAGLDRQIDRLKRMQAIARHTEQVWQRAEQRREKPEAGRGATSAPDIYGPPPPPSGAMQPPRIPTPETEMAKQDRSLIAPPAAPGRQQADPDAALARMDGTKHHAVNTMGPTPEDIPEEPEARANYYRALRGQPHPGNVKDANDRAKAGREQEARLKAAGQDAAPEQPRNAADALMAELKRQAEEKAKQEGPPRERDDDRGSGRDR